MAVEDATDTEADADGERDDGSFWTRRVYAGAGVLFLLRTPTVLSSQTTAGAIGTLLGLVVGSLAFAGVAKLLWVGGQRAAGRLDPR